VLAIGAIVTGCGGGSGSRARTDAHSCGSSHWLTIYSDLPLAGSDRFDMTSMYNGEWLALHQAGKHVGPCRVQLESYSDAAASSGSWDPGLTEQVARRASSDPSAIAYIGDFDSGATATSLQITDASDTLQISPWSPYVGFTGAGPADDEGDPARYQSSGHNTFARLVPSDYTQAQATIDFMAREGATRLFVLGDVSDPFDADIAQLIANGAPAGGVTVVGYNATINLETNTQPQGYAPYALQARAARADAVVLGGRPGPGALALFAEMHAMLPHAKLFAPSTLATPWFLSRLGDAAASTYVTSPILGWWQYPASARRMKRDYHRRFGIWPTKYALYGYEAVEDVLAAIQHADYQTGPAALLRAFFEHLGRRRGVIGDYTIYPDGNISLSRFDGYRVGAGGKLVYVMPVPVG